MKERNITKISLSTILLFCAIIAIIVMGILIYKINNDKTNEMGKYTELQAQVNSLNETISDLQKKINTISKNADSNKSSINSNSNNSLSPEEQSDSESNESALKNGTYETESVVDLSDGDGIYKITIENNLFTIYLSYGGRFEGTYTIADNILTCNANEEIITEGGYSKNTTNAIFEFKIINNDKLEFITSKNISSEYNISKGFIYNKK